MGRPRKKAPELTTDEVMRRLFPKPAVTTAKTEAHKADEKAHKREETKARKAQKAAERAEKESKTVERDPSQEQG